MDNLIKAMRCFLTDCQCSVPCETCAYNQNEYDVLAEDLLNNAIQKITDLQKSNRNWRRKAQRLRKKIKELEGKENV
jgi:hypothetical protein